MEALLLVIALGVGSTPAPTPTPPSKSAVFVSGGGYMTVVSQSASGPGTVFPVTLGSMDDPQTPYEFFSGTPGLTGTGAQASLHLNFTYQAQRLRFDLSTGSESYDGSGPNILYLGETPFPTANPFVDSRTQSFSSYLGRSDSVGASRTSVIAGSIAANDGSWKLNAGWFLPQHSLPFVFTPPPLPNVPPALAPELAESLAPGAPQLQQWQPQWPALPLHGIDAQIKRSHYSAEIFDAALPTRYYDAQFNDVARIDAVSLAFAGQHGARFAFQAEHVHENTLGGYSPIPAGVMWGGSEETEVGVEGPQPESDTFGQRSTLIGFSAHLPVGYGTSLLGEIGRSWFAAQYFSKPGQPTPGGYYHLGADHSWGSQTLSIDVYRFEPTYAPNVLPYGNFVDIWPVAWAWPANWLKSNYQLVENGDVSVNRQGVRFRYASDGRRFSLKAGYAKFAQVTPYNSLTATLPGFTDPFFTSRDDAIISYRGTQSQIAAWLGWKTPWLTSSLDFVEDFLNRRAPPGNREEGVHMTVPQAILTLSHADGNVVYAIGHGLFAFSGCYALCNVANIGAVQRVYFAGINVKAAPRSLWMLEWRRYLTSGVPFADLATPPTYTGTRIILEERFTLSRS